MFHFECSTTKTITETQGKKRFQAIRWGVTSTSTKKIGPFHEIIDWMWHCIWLNEMYHSSCTNINWTSLANHWVPMEEKNHSQTTKWVMINAKTSSNHLGILKSWLFKRSKWFWCSYHRPIWRVIVFKFSDRYRKWAKCDRKKKTIPFIRDSLWNQKPIGNEKKLFKHKRKEEKVHL